MLLGEGRGGGYKILASLIAGGGLQGELGGYISGYLPVDSLIHSGKSDMVQPGITYFKEDTRIVVVMSSVKKFSFSSSCRQQLKIVKLI